MARPTAALVAAAVALLVLVLVATYALYRGPGAYHSTSHFKDRQLGLDDDGLGNGSSESDESIINPNGGGLTAGPDGPINPQYSRDAPRPSSARFEQMSNPGRPVSASFVKSSAGVPQDRALGRARPRQAAPGRARYTKEMFNDSPAVERRRLIDWLNWDFRTYMPT